MGYISVVNGFIFGNQLKPYHVRKKGKNKQIHKIAFGGHVHVFV
jgi:hypothetical protein